MPRLELQLLGPFQVFLDGQAITSFKSNKVRALLAFLTAEAERPQRRALLAELIWPDWPEKSAMRNLTFTLADLRKSIADQLSQPPFLRINRDGLQLNPTSHIQVDLWDFTRLVKSGAPPANTDRATRLNQLRSAIDLYRGAFMDGFSLADSAPYEEWLGSIRQQVNHLMVQALGELAEAYLGQGEYEQGLIYARRRVELEPWVEEGHQQIMRLLAQSGQRGAALAQYKACCKALADELSVEPSMETKRLYEAIRDEALGPTTVKLSEALVSLAELLPAPGEPPFKGLQYFDTPDAGLFYGREVLIQQLSARLIGESFLMIVGASGSGKSSLVRAGLVPAWSGGIEFPGGRLNGAVHIITPTVHPLESLAASLTRDSESVTATSTLMDDLAKDARSLQLYVRKLLRLSGDAHLLLVVDQFEEVFTACKDTNERKAFIDNLLTAVSAENVGPLRAVLTLRADFYQHCAEYEGLRQALEQHQAYIGAMTRDELRQAIEAPALANGLGFQPGLVDLILQDVGKEPGALPLLSHALLETWRRRQGSTLTLDGYTAAGGVRKAIALSAESFYGSLAPAEQALARSIFLRLAELGEGEQDTRRRARLDELVPSAEQQAATTAMLKGLADARLITIDQDCAEVAHEALIREWPTLRNWLDEDRQGLRIHRHLTESAQGWQRCGRDPGELYAGARLGQAQEWAVSHTGQLNPLEQEFLNAALEAAQRAEKEREAQRQRELAQARSLVRTQRQRSAVLVVGLGIAILLAGLSFWFYSQSQANLRVALSRQLVSQAQSILGVGKPQQIIALLAVQSLKLSPSFEASQILQKNTLVRQVSRMVHNGKVYSITFSPDGRFIISGSADGTARVWEAASGKEIARMTHAGLVNSVAFSSDGRYVVSGSYDYTARVWDAASGVEIARMTHQEAVTSVAFSPDGRYVVSGGYDNTARVWDAASGVEIARMIHAGWVTSVAFSPDGRYVVSGSYDNTARVWDAASGGEVARLTHSDKVYAVTFSPDGKFVASGSTDHTARVWVTANGVEIAHMTHAGLVTSTAFSPDGRYVVSGSYDTTARVWDAANGKEIARMTHAGGVSSTAFSPDGHYIVSGSSDGSISLWSAASGKEIANMTHDGAVTSLAFSPDGRYVISGSADGTARVWESFSGMGIAHVIHNDSVNSVAFSPDGHYVVSGSADGTTRVWDMSGKEIDQWSHAGPVNSVAFSPDSRYVVSGGANGAAREWEVASGKKVVFFYQLSAVVSIAISPDSRYVVSGNETGLAVEWNAANGEWIAWMTHDNGANLEIPLETAVVSVAFSPDGRYVVSGSYDHTARVWDAASGKEIARMTHDDKVNSVAFSPDGRYVVSGSTDRTVRVWDAASGVEIARITHAGAVNSVAFSPDGRYVISASNDATARVWVAASGEEIARINHFGHVVSVAFSPDSRYVVSGSADGTARVWEAASGKEIGGMIHDGAVTSVAFSPDGRYVVSGSTDGTARVWPFLPADMIAEACTQLSRNLTRAEWQFYIGDALPYREVCPNLPLEPQSTPTPKP